MRKFKGFTLVECLIALAILGIASLVMAQIYANVSRINKSNHDVNTSLSYQMKLVEKRTNSEAIPLLFGGGAAADPESKDASTTKKPPHKQGIAASDLTKPYVRAKSSYKLNGTDETNYSYSADIYILMTRDYNDKPSSDANYKGPAEKTSNLRYKYIVGHPNN